MTTQTFHLLVDVGGTYRGVHVHNQSDDDNISIFRHAGLGNLLRLEPTSQGEHLQLEVRGNWKAAHVYQQGTGDNTRLIRHRGEGNPVRFSAARNGAQNIAIAVGNAWNGVHVYQQKEDDRTDLVRHSGEGNDFIVIPNTPFGKPSGSYHLLVEVDGVYKGLHVRDQSTADGAVLVRQKGLGNEIRFTPDEEVDDAWQLEIAINGVFEPLQVSEQKPGDSVNLVRHTGHRNAVRIVSKPDGTVNLLVASVGDGWRGVHIQNQRSDDGTPLIRHQGNGNTFVLVPIPAPVVVTPPVAEVPPVVEAPKADDLTIIEGIGPRIQELFAAAGLVSFAQVAAATPEALKAILTAGGNRFATADPTTWPEQARLAGAGEHDALAALQAVLKGGRA